MGFSREGYWSGLPFPPPGDLPDPRIEPRSPVAPALAGEFFTTEPPGKSHQDLLLHTLTLGARVSAYEFGRTQICRPKQVPMCSLKKNFVDIFVTCVALSSVGPRAAVTLDWFEEFITARE